MLIASTQIRDFFAERSITPPQLVPMIRARLIKIDGKSASDLKIQSDRGRDFLDREANLTWAETMQDDNKLVAGEWWRPDDGGGPRVSVELEMAEALGLNVGVGELDSPHDVLGVIDVDVAHKRKAEEAHGLLAVHEQDDARVAAALDTHQHPLPRRLEHALPEQRLEAAE